MPGSIDDTQADDASTQSQQEQQQVPAAAAPTPAQPAKNHNPISKALNPICAVFMRTPAPPAGPPPPTTITCGECKKAAGHYSKDCPLLCSYCGKKGHEPVDCEPHCQACNGHGYIKKQHIVDPEAPDHPDPAIRKLMTFVRGVKEVAPEALQAVGEERGAGNEQYKRLKNQFDASLAYLALAEAGFPHLARQKAVERKASESS